MLALAASPAPRFADLDPTTVLIDGFPGAARRTAATYVLTNTHRPTPSGRSVQNYRDTDANRISHRREPRRVGGSRARSMLKMWLDHPRKVILASRPAKIIWILGVVQATLPFCDGPGPPDHRGSCKRQPTLGVRARARPDPLSAHD